MVSGPNPGPRRVRQRQRERRPDGQPGVRQCRRHVLPDLVRPRDRPEHDRRRGDPLVGAGALPRARTRWPPSRSARTARRLYVFNANGAPLATPRRSHEPDDHGPRRRQHVVLLPGQIIDTSNPPFPGEPATSTNLSQDLPSFFGTSSAAPNAAAVAALMLQQVPSLTPAEIRAGPDRLGVDQPMNGATPGTWNPQGGYGLVNADRRASTPWTCCASRRPVRPTARPSPSPPAPSQVTFNKPVELLDALGRRPDLHLGPRGRDGQRRARRSPSTTRPTRRSFSSRSASPAAGAHGQRRLHLLDPEPRDGPVVVARTARTWSPPAPITFTLADITAPAITGTAVSGRTVTITFSKALDPTRSRSTTSSCSAKGTSADLAARPAATSRAYTNLNSDPRATISYNPLTYTVTLDYSNLPQTEMPTDKYAIVVCRAPRRDEPGVTDLVGNPLDGYYTGGFPTGLPADRPYDFIQNLGFEALQAPIDHDLRDEPRRQRHRHRRRSEHQHQRADLHRPGLRAVPRHGRRLTRSTSSSAAAQRRHHDSGCRCRRPRLHRQLRPSW